MEQKPESSKTSRCLRSLVEKMRRLKVIGEFGYRSLSPSSNYLPPEIQEMILERIDDEKVLLRCRQVNWHWHKMASALLEERQLARWKEFEPRQYDIPLCPTVRILDKNWKPGDCYHVGCPLAMLKLKYCECSECVNWIIHLTHRQLTSLEVYSCVGPYNRRRRFSKLKRLKICDLENEEVQKMVFEVDDTLSLEYFSIITVIEQIYELDAIVDFINRFPSTLTYLHIDIDETVRARAPNFGDRLVELLKSGDVFPSLKQLEISRMKGREWDEVKLRAALESRFPNLESVRVQTNRDWAEDLKEVPVYDDCVIV